MAIGADQSGTISAMIHEGRTETAKYDLYEDGLTGNPRFLYRVPDMRSTYRVVPLDVNLPTYMRGPGAVTGTFALESGMDDLAHRLGLDPIELRLRNEPIVIRQTACRSRHDGSWSVSSRAPAHSAGSGVIRHHGSRATAVSSSESAWLRRPITPPAASVPYWHE